MKSKWLAGFSAVALAMIGFIQDRVKPDIEKRFRIDRTRQMLAGMRAWAAADPASLEGESPETYLAEMEKSPARMVDNARDMARILTGKGLKVRYRQFPEEDHFAVLPSRIGRAVPFAFGE